MPTERKINSVEEMRRWMEECTVAISTDYTGLSVSAMTGLRRSLREKNVQFRIIKNTLAYRAADAAGRPAFKEIVEGPTAFAFSYGEPTDPAKALVEFIRATRSPLKIRGGILGDRILTLEEVNNLATLPSKEELIARLMGQLNAPAAGLVYVLNANIAGLARVLQRHVENLEKVAE